MQFNLKGAGIAHEFSADTLDAAKARTEKLAKLLEQPLTLLCGELSPGQGEARFVFDVAPADAEDSEIEIEAPDSAAAAAPPESSKPADGDT